MTRILKGRPIADEMKREAAGRAAALRGAGLAPGLAVLMVGGDPASKIYTSSIEKAGGDVGVAVRVVELPETAADEDVAGALRTLDADPGVHGVIVQQPLPRGISPEVVEELSPAKDVDGSTTRSAGLLAVGRPAFAPCTASAVVELLRRSEIGTSGRHVVIVGRSPVVGRPLAQLLLRKGNDGDATVTVCHSRTEDLARHTLSADILVAAMGRREAIRGDMIREGAVVVDVGVNRVEDPEAPKGRRVVGDVAFDEACERASAITPVPGGVGSLTTALLLSNVVRAAGKDTEREGGKA